MIKAERTKRRIKASNPERNESPDCEGSGLFRSTSIAAALRRVEEGGVATVDHKGEEEEAKDSAQGPGQETLSRWLASNPGIEVISRDRSETYATGARQGAPDATQVADIGGTCSPIGEKPSSASSTAIGAGSRGSYCPLHAKPEPGTMGQ